MANKTINQLDEISTVSDSDEFAIYDVSEETTKKIKKSTLLDGMQEELTFDEEPTASSTNPVTSGGVFSANAVITASSTTLEGVTISSGSVIRVMFTSAITGSDTTTALSLTYNDTAYSVMVGKQGSLTNFVASEIDSAYYYLQAYTTLELAFDGTQFIIIGNPVVYSSDDYTIYADGKTEIYKEYELIADETYITISNYRCVRHNNVVTVQAYIFALADIPAGQYIPLIYGLPKAAYNPNGLVAVRDNSTSVAGFLYMGTGDYISTVQSMTSGYWYVFGSYITDDEI